MESLYSVKLGKLIQEFRLEVLRGGAGYEERTGKIGRLPLRMSTGRACSSPDFSTTLTPSGSR